MDTFQIAAWSVVVGLSLMLVGGLVLWAYGGGRDSFAVESGGPEAEATQRFHHYLARWFFRYGIAIIVIGLLLLGWGAAVFI